MSEKEAVKDKKPSKKNEPAKVSDANDVSAVFFSQYNTQISPLENEKISGLIENFTILFKRTFSGFLGKKIGFQFDSIKFCDTKSLDLHNASAVLSSVRIMPINQLGVIFLDYSLIHTVIDILFGAGVYKGDAIITNLGKSGLPIAQKITDLCASAFQDAVCEFEKIQIDITKTTEQPSLILNQALSDQFFDLTFLVDFNEMSCPIHIAIPDALFENLTLKDEVEPIENSERTTMNETIKRDIIDSTITLTASLQEVQLKLSEIMNLKSGDLIPITDPTQVYLSHNQKKMFKGSAGQANALRVVKILDTLS